MKYRLLLSALAFTFFFASCNRQFATVQPTKLENFSAKKNVISTPDVFTIEPLNLTATTASVGEAFSGNTASDLPIVKMPDESHVLTKSTMRNRVEAVPIRAFKNSKENPVFSKKSGVKEVKKITKKKKKLFNRTNTLIPGGLVLLGVAILLSLVNLTGLALLFGAASILFLYLGIRKMMRKNRRRKIFKR